jgi:hypothetical protein
MKGVHSGTTAFSISVKEVPIPKIVNQTDAIIRLTFQREILQPKSLDWSPTG